MPTLRTMSMSKSHSYAGGKLPNIHDMHITNISQFVPINVDKLNCNKREEEIDNLFEFMMVSLSRSLEIHPKNVVCFFANNGRLLANVLIKGMRSNGFDGVMSWLSYLLLHLDKIVGMLLLDPTHGMLHLFALSLKAGLLSKDTDVVTATCNIYIELATKLRAKN